MSKMFKEDKDPAPTPPTLVWPGENYRSLEGMVSREAIIADLVARIIRIKGDPSYWQPDKVIGDIQIRIRKLRTYREGQMLDPRKFGARSVGVESIGNAIEQAAYDSMEEAAIANAKNFGTPDKIFL